MSVNRCRHRSPARLYLAPVLALLALGALPATAGAEQVLTYRYGPITVGPYQVDLRELVYDVPKPQVDGYVTGGEINLVDANGAPVPIQRVMLHHVGVANLGSRVGERHDATCDRFTMLDGQTQNLGYAERFFAVGEERVVAELPEGYGYPVKGSDRWAASWMLMNHRNRAESVFLEYKLRYETERELTPAYPVWLDVRNCLFDPVYDVPGGRRRGSLHAESTTWTAPYSGRIVAALGHVHGGGKEVVLSQPDCADRVLLRSRPTWALPRDPEYRIKPLIHEPGPINMELVKSREGFPVSAGQRLRLTSIYDGRLPHTRVMGIMGLYITPDPSVTDGCGPLPADAETVRGTRPGRTRTPLVRVPINGVRASGRVGAIKRPAGRAVALGGSPIETIGSRFQPANAVARRGQTVRWRFWDRDLHTVTVANGPEGFGSPNLSDGRLFRHRFRKPGTYRLYCSLHPLSMTGTVRVVRGRGRG